MQTRSLTRRTGGTRTITTRAQGGPTKDTAPAEIVAAVRRVAQGRPVLSPAVTRGLIARVAGSTQDVRRRTAPRERLAPLNDREREVAVPEEGDAEEGDLEEGD
jgi:DNA-binding NarL/FixJ family response regulator